MISFAVAVVSLLPLLSLTRASLVTARQEGGCVNCPATDAAGNSVSRDWANSDILICGYPAGGLCIYEYVS